MSTPILFSEDQENSQFSLEFTKNLFKALFSKSSTPSPHPFPDTQQQSTDEDLSPIYSRPFILNKSFSDIIPHSHIINPTVFSNSLPTMSVFLMDEPERKKDSDNERFTVIIEDIKINEIELVLENEGFMVPELILMESNQAKKSEIIKNPWFSNFFTEIIDEIVEKLENSETSPEKIGEEDLTSPETNRSIVSSPFKISDISSKKYSGEESLDDFQSQKAIFYKKLETIAVNPCSEDIDEKEISEKNEENCTLEELTNEETVKKPREFITTVIKQMPENSIMVETNKENNKMPDLVKNGSSSASTQENSSLSGIFTKGSSVIEENKENIIREGILLKKSRNFLSGWQVIKNYCFGRIFIGLIEKMVRFDKLQVDLLQR